MKFLHLILIVIAGCYTSSVVAAPYEVEMRTYTDEFEDRYDTSYTLIGNSLSGVKSHYVEGQIRCSVKIELIKYSFSPNIYLVFKYLSFDMPRYQKNLILLVDGNREVYVCQIDDDQRWPVAPHYSCQSAELIVNPRLMARIARAKEVKVKLKRILSGLYGPVTGYLGEDTIKNFQRFYEEYVVSER